jgi:predicted PhzF superfamily epimerase YddE/YHI9
MARSIKAEVVRVFTDDDGNFGNPIGIISDEGRKLSNDERARIAERIGFSETVFINSFEKGSISMLGAALWEVPFVGHGVVGTAWYMAKTNPNLTTIKCRDMDVTTWIDGDVRWVSAPLAFTPPYIHVQLKNPSAVERLTLDDAQSMHHSYVWAWDNEVDGIVRARSFAFELGISEDEGNGSGSMQRASELNRKLKIKHGNGSVIYASPIDKKHAAVGGRVVQDKPRHIEF